MINIETLSVREQFEIVMAVSAICLITAVSFREWVKDPHVRMIGRVLGVAGWLVVAAYSYDATKVIESQNVQLAGKQQKAEGIDAKTLMTFVSPAGNKIIIQKDDNGLRRTDSELRRADGTHPSIAGSLRGIANGDATETVGTHGTMGSSRDGWNDGPRLPDWTGWFSRNDHRDAGSFEFSGEAQGQAF